MSDQNYKPSGELQGDTKPMPNRGTSSGMVPGSNYGASMDVNATNSMGSAHLAPDPMEMCCPPGDGRFVARGHSTTSPGGALSGADSDAMMDVTPEDPKGL